jgi:alpha-galactosidase
MGDWLIPSAKFKAGVPSLIAKIRAAGKKAGIWIAPFIAQPESHLFRQHPDWFVKDHRGKPLAAESVTYGGWRCTPWYMLDGTHPEVKGYLTRVIQTMRNEWGVDYFKLDANFWGACHGGQYFRQNATRVEAYREGMAAINDAADGAFILGCNAPMWPSLGLVDGMRIADDIERQQHRFIQLRDEIFFRNWCHQRLWINDPDCLVLRNIPAQFASEANYRLHIATVVASGGILMLGDRLESLSERQKALVSRLSELLAKKFGAAKFTDFNNEIGIAENARGRLIAVTNPGAEHKHYSIPLEGNERAEVLIGNGLIKSDLIEIKLEGYDGVVIETVRN